MQTRPLAPVERAYGLVMLPWGALLRRLVWPLRHFEWWNLVDEWTMVGGRINAEDVKALAQRGVRAFVNLCAEYEDPIAEIEAAGMDHLHLPTLDGHPPAINDLGRVCAFMTRNARREWRTYLHSSDGVGRAATAAAAWLVHCGWEPKNALLMVSDRRPMTSMSQEQTQAVYEFARRREQSSRLPAEPDGAKDARSDLPAGEAR